MAVYKKTYRPYEGALAPSWKRLLAIPRYALEDLHRSRFLNIFYVSTFAYPLIAAIIIYLEHNLTALQALNAERVASVVAIDPGFFMNFLGWQSMLALFLAAFIGPGLVSPDLSNNALSLYLARPFSRAEYVLGKASVLLLLMSLMTWVPGLLLFAYQGYLEGGTWMASNGRVASGLFFGAWIWMLWLSLLALALSAWVKWKPAAGALMFGVFFVAAGFGEAINQIEDTKWGLLLSAPNVIGTLWVWLFEGDHPVTNGGVFFRMDQHGVIPVWTCWAALAALCFLCFYILARKIRGAEVVK
jgi:ABC-2 type transport system permease protein